MTSKFNKKIEVGISVGDLSGVGIEVILKSFSLSPLFEVCTPILFVSESLIRERITQLQIDVNIKVIQSLDEVFPDVINVYQVWEEEVKVVLGQEKSCYGLYAFKSLEVATNALKNRAIDVLVTAPINKHTIRSDKFPFSGHTGYLDYVLDGQALMMMVCDAFKVALLTDHIPLSEVTNAVTKQALEEKIKILSRALIQDFDIQNPKIAVLGLNPHAGDQGIIGNHEQQVIIPGLNKLRCIGHDVSGPFSADTFFVSKYKEFDAVLAMYHDQGLIPFKVHSFGMGVNVTVGLSGVRTSPDHGTAHDIAAKGMADPSSFKQAVLKAVEIYRNRNRLGDS